MKPTLLRRLFMSTYRTQAATRLAITHQHLCPNRCFGTAAPTIDLASITNVNQGAKYTSDFKNYAVSNNKVISYFHDVPLGLDVDNKTANMIVEIPRWSNAKFEISPDLPGNPIVQDTKKGEVRFVKNLFPHHGYIHNYGAFPQTWEDPTTKNEELDLFGDNDPLDVCEIGSAVFRTGDIKTVKILGSIALIDDGELDWKVIVVNVQDPLSNELFDIHDVFVKCPGLLETTRQWFRDYKKPDGKPSNKFAFNGVYKNQQETIQTIQECHHAWEKLVNHQVTSSNKLPVTHNVTQTALPSYIDQFNTEALLSNPARPDAPIPEDIDRSHFCSSD